jgi:Flp pilus assembly protein TadG
MRLARQMMLRFRQLRKLLSGSSGTEIAEAAFVLPLVFMLLFAIVWFGLAFKLYSTINRAAREGALTAARPSCVTCGDAFPSDAAVETAVFGVLQAGHVDTSQIQSYVPPPLQSGTIQFCAPPAPGGACTTTGSNITICRSVLLNATSLSPTGRTPQQCGTTVSFKYPFGGSFPFPTYPFSTWQQIFISTASQSLMQN